MGILAQVLERTGNGGKHETDSVFDLHWNSRFGANCCLTGPCPTAPRGGQGVHGLRVFGPGQRRFVPQDKGQYMPL
jgi:hypothetical protein